MSTRFVANSMADVSVAFRPLYLCSSCGGTPTWCRNTIAELYTLIWVTQLIRISVTQKVSQTWTLATMFAHRFISFHLLWIEWFWLFFLRCVCERFIFLLPSTQVSKVAKEQIKRAEKTQYAICTKRHKKLWITSLWTQILHLNFQENVEKMMW